MRSFLASKSATIEVLERHGLSAKHKLGQNFLVDDNVIDNIIKLAGLDQQKSEGEGKQDKGEQDKDKDGKGKENGSKDGGGKENKDSKDDKNNKSRGKESKEDKDGKDKKTAETCLLEIGPGLGTLSCALLEYAKLIAIEKDNDLLDVLLENTAKNASRVFVIEKDALKVELADIEFAAQQLQTTMPSHLIANLPYQIAATLILDYFERFDFLQEMTVMVQKEVADRIGATLGTKDYGAYSIKLSFYAKVCGRFNVSPTCFYPKPHVESAVIHLERIDCKYGEHTYGEHTRKLAAQLTNAAFAQRRKTIRNSMKSAYDADIVDVLLASCNIDPRIRAETLKPEVFLEMACKNKDLLSDNIK